MSATIVMPNNQPQTGMVQIFGDFSTENSPEQEVLTLIFSPSTDSLTEHWVKNGLSADFLATYFAALFEEISLDKEKIDKQNEIKSAVSYIANELLENAMKYHDKTLPYKISVMLQQHSDRVVFIASNSIRPEVAQKFQNFIKELLANDPSELDLTKLEKNAFDENIIASQLGYLTMINDYVVKVGWKFETLQNNPAVITVTVKVQLAL